MPRVSLLTITNRPGGMDIALANQRRQTVQEFEWILVDALREQRGPYGIPEPPKTRLGNMAASVNEGLAHCRGEYIVLLQDYIWIPPRGIERFLKAQEKRGPCLVTGVGNVGSGPPATHPDGLHSVFDEPYERPPTGLSWADPRKTHLKGLQPCEPVAWEANWACLPLAVAEELGGFDEEYDNGWAWDHVQFAERARLAGYPLYVDMDNECKAFPHDTYFPNPLKADRSLSNAERYVRDIEVLRKGQKPLRMPYLAQRREALCQPSAP